LSTLHMRAFLVTCALLVLRPGSCALLLGRRAAVVTAGVSCGTAFPERGCAADAVVAATLSDKLEMSAALAPEAQMPLRLALRPAYGIETPDVSYPDWALGRWTATSTLQSVYAPAGEELFAPGRNGSEALRRARIDAPLTYEVRWRRGGDSVVVDRAYNVAAISRASMGASAVQNIDEDGPDHLSLVLRPAGAPPTSLFAADLRVVARRTDSYPSKPDRPNLFACAETTRQTVTSIAGEKAQGGPPKSPLVKEIETICTYELDARNPNVMRGAQRTATFLVPDAAYTGDPSLMEVAASRLARTSDGQYVAIDVRIYDVMYTRVV